MVKRYLLFFLMRDRQKINLEQLSIRSRQSLGIIHKQDIQVVSQILELNQSEITVGDDCAAIPDGDGYLLLATEGMWDVLVAEDPWFAGWCGVMVNVSDIAAMGGRAIAVVNTIWTENQAQALPLLEGMKAASQAFNVPIVGGHTNLRSRFSSLGVAILGRSNKLISSFTAQRGDLLVVAVDFAGKMHPQFPFWNAATESTPDSLTKKVQILPWLAEHDLCRTGKDISMGGIIGTLLMLIESSHCGAVLNLDNVICPDGIDLETWLLAFPSYGFLLSVSA
ncbi:MAG: sll0787 family AIR synthase-like protein, partial [Cyanobacteria bacterium J06558_2]